MQVLLKKPNRKKVNGVMDKAGSILDFYSEQIEGKQGKMPFTFKKP